MIEDQQSVPVDLTDRDVPRNLERPILGLLVRDLGHDAMVAHVEQRLGREEALHRSISLVRVAWIARTEFHRSGNGGSTFIGCRPVSRTSRASRLSHSSGVPTSLASTIVGTELKGIVGYSAGRSAGRWVCFSATSCSDGGANGEGRRLRGTDGANSLPVDPGDEGGLDRVCESEGTRSSRTGAGCEMLVLVRRAWRASSRPRDWERERDLDELSSVRERETEREARWASIEGCGRGQGKSKSKNCG